MRGAMRGRSLMLNVKWLREVLFYVEDGEREGEKVAIARPSSFLRFGEEESAMKILK